MKRNMKAALKSSLENEEKSVKDRFEVAESVITQSERRKSQNSLSRSQAAQSQSEAEKVKRDTFTIPEKDYKLIHELKMRCMKAGVGVSKSELIRAGIILLSEIPSHELVNIVGRLDRLKVGRKPTKDKM